MKLSEVLNEASPITVKQNSSGPQKQTTAQVASDNQQLKLGTFGALAPSKKSQQKLTFFMEDNDIPNPVLPEEMHCTLLQSKTYVPGFTAEGTLQKPILANNLRCQVFTKNDAKNGGTRQILVITFNSPEILRRRQKLIDDAGPDYKEAATSKEFVPHVTLSYDAGADPIDVDLLTYKLSQYLTLLAFDYEYETPLELNHTPSNTQQQ